MEPTRSIPTDDVDPAVIAAHGEHDHRAAMFPDRSTAIAAVDALRALGFGSDHLGIAVRADEPTVFEHDMGTELRRDMEVGAAGGAPLGFLAGLALAAFAVPGIAVGGVLALAGVGAGWGAFLGSVLGLGVGDVASGAHERIEQIHHEVGEVLVVVCSHGYPAVVDDVLVDHGGRLVELGPLSS